MRRWEEVGGLGEEEEAGVGENEEEEDDAHQDGEDDNEEEVEDASKPQQGQSPSSSKVDIVNFVWCCLLAQAKQHSPWT